MQMKLIAAAVAGLLSSTAFAQVTIGGRFESGYMFSHTQNADSPTGGPAGGLTKESQQDGVGTTTRLVFTAREEISPNIKTGMDIDLRFGNADEGKTGITSNDKKLMFLSVKPVTAQFGFGNNVSTAYFIMDKPWVQGMELDINKNTKLAFARVDGGTNRIFNLFTDPDLISFAGVQVMLKASYAGGENRKSGLNNDGGESPSVTTKKSGDLTGAGFEFKMGSLLNGGADTNYKRTNNLATEDGMNWQQYVLNVRPIAGLKIGTSYVVEKGYAGASTLAYKDKAFSISAGYTIGQATVSANFARLNDFNSGDNTRNSGHQYNVGVQYSLSKQTIIFAGYSKTDFERNTTTATGGFKGTAAGFTSGSFAKVDDKVTRIGITKLF